MRENRISPIKRCVIVLMMALLLTNLVGIPAYADIGPKPLINIKVENPPSDNCIATLLGPVEAWGPHRLDADSEKSHKGEDLDAFVAFREYADQDDFYFWGEIFSVKNGEFTFGYWPPESFKVLIYDPTDGRLYVSSEQEQYAFDSYFIANIVPDGTINVRQSGVRINILGFLSRVILTCIIELWIAVLFGYKIKKELLIIAITNLVTQVILNILCYWEIHFDQEGDFLWSIRIFPYELLVFLIEAAVYILGLRSHSKKRAVGYALTANLVTLFLGFILWANIG